MIHEIVACNGVRVGRKNDLLSLFQSPLTPRRKCDSGESAEAGIWYGTCTLDLFAATAARH